MFAETGVPVLLGLFCEVNAGVLATAAGAVAAHSATAYWDQAYAEPRRRVTPAEQMVHSLLEVSPVMATFLLTALHWDQARALPRPLAHVHARDAPRRGDRVRGHAVRRGTAALLARQPPAQPASRADPAGYRCPGRSG